MDEVTSLYMLGTIVCGDDIRVIGGWLNKLRNTAVASRKQDDKYFDTYVQPVASSFSISTGNITGSENIFYEDRYVDIKFLLHKFKAKIFLIHEYLNYTNISGF